MKEETHKLLEQAHHLVIKVKVETLMQVAKHLEYQDKHSTTGSLMTKILQTRFQTFKKV